MYIKYEVSIYPSPHMSVYKPASLRLRTMASFWAGETRAKVLIQGQIADTCVYVCGGYV